MLSKTNMFTNFITKPHKNLFLKLNWDFVGFTFNKTAKIWFCYNALTLQFKAPSLQNHIFTKKNGPFRYPFLTV